MKIDLREKNVEELAHEMLAELNVSCLANPSQHTRTTIEALAEKLLIIINVVKIPTLYLSNVELKAS